MQKVLFFHGGPGMNGNPERQLLTKPFEKEGFELVCWDEPSALRPGGFPFDPENAFENYQRSASKFVEEQAQNGQVVLFMFCFSCSLLEGLLRDHGSKVKLLLIGTPDFSIFKTDLNLFRLLHDDFREHQEAEAEKEMEQVIAHFSPRFDENTRTGWMLAAGNPRLFHSYWKDKALMQQYLTYYEGAYAIDVDSFFSIRQTQIPTTGFRTGVPALLTYGKHERIVSVPDELSGAAAMFINLTVVGMEHSAHYPHIEETSRFLAVLKQALE